MEDNEPDLDKQNIKNDKNNNRLLRFLDKTLKRKKNRKKCNYFRKNY